VKRIHPSLNPERNQKRNATERSDDGAISTRIPIQSARSVVRSPVDAGATTDATCGEEINETDATTRRRRRSVKPPIGRRNRPNADPSNADRRDAQAETTGEMREATRARLGGRRRRARRRDGIPGDVDWEEKFRNRERGETREATHLSNRPSASTVLTPSGTAKSTVSGRVPIRVSPSPSLDARGERSMVTEGCARVSHPF
jgi:hypothetical protein